MKGGAIGVLAVVVLLWGPAVNVSTAKYSGGTGEPNDPYRVATANDLNDIGNHVEDFNKCFIMVNDINLADYTGTQFKIIGNYPSNPFAGVFDGNERSITNFTYQGDASLVGLFGCVSHPNAVIKDLTLVDPNVDGGTGDLVGALAGLLESGTISSCGTVGGSVVASENVGGVVGASWGGQISNCYASGSVCGEDRAGGLVGTGSQANISHCYATGAVRGNLEIGGLVGHIDNGAVVECYASADVGGLQHIGGLAGYHKSVIGRGGITSCYASGPVSGDWATGGLVGINAGDVKHCYAAGIVDANEAGGLIGHDIGPSYYTKCFWDSDVNPDVNGIGSTTDPNVIGKTTAEMQTESTFTDAGWDFVEVWGIGENQTYPFLRKYLAGDLNHDGIVNFYDYAIFALDWMGGEWPVGIE